MTFTDWAMSLGGIGFLLLGMSMMTEGLKAAAGDSLRTILERSTQTRMRSLMTGFSLTALVQSSSAVIMTTLGFTNAGMLNMRKAAWVVFGSNVGTTMTAWIVALIGLKIRVDVVALPLIGLGMLLHLFLRGGRWKHLGFAAAGFGVLFFGLGALRDAFDNIATVFPVEQIAAVGLWGVALGVLAGAVLTLLMQSSSAALAIVLTAAVTGVFTPLIGASLVIGANVGTTGTSILASIGATPNARRLAWVHVLQKGLTSVIALLLLWPMWLIADYIAVHTGGTITTALAVYHTLFNVLGVALMWAFAERLFRFVERRIKQTELMSEKPRYLDKTVVTSSAMGVGAMQSELKRVFKQLLRRGRGVLGLEESGQRFAGAGVEASVRVDIGVDGARSAPMDGALEDDGAESAEDINSKALLERIGEFGDELAQVTALGDQSEAYLNCMGNIRQLHELRFNINSLRNYGSDEIQAALGPELLQPLDDILGSGRLKLLNAEHRTQFLETIIVAGKTRRGELLRALERSGYGDDRASAPDVAQGAVRSSSAELAASATDATGAGARAGAQGTGEQGAGAHGNDTQETGRNGTGTHGAGSTGTQGTSAHRTGGHENGGQKKGTQGNGGAQIRTKVTRQLAILDHSEQIAKYVIRSAEVLYPAE